MIYIRWYIYIYMDIYKVLNQNAPALPNITKHCAWCVGSVVFMFKRMCPPGYPGTLGGTLRPGDTNVQTTCKTYIFRAISPNSTTSCFLYWKCEMQKLGGVSWRTPFFAPRNVRHARQVAYVRHVRHPNVRQTYAQVVGFFFESLQIKSNHVAKIRAQIKSNHDLISISNQKYGCNQNKSMTRTKIKPWQGPKYGTDRKVSASSCVRLRRERLLRHVTIYSRKTNIDIGISVLRKPQKQYQLASPRPHGNVTP